MYSQNDSRAINLLNKVSEKIDSSVSFKISFTYTLENINEGINQNSDGSIIIKEDNYLLDFMGIKQLSDANKIYSIVPENEEIIISNIEDDDNNTIKPSKLLVFYRDGYLILWDKKEIIDDNVIQFVKLIPIDSEKTNLQILHLYKVGFHWSTSSALWLVHSTLISLLFIFEP